MGEPQPPAPATPANADTIISKIQSITGQIDDLKQTMQMRIQNMEKTLKASTTDSDEEARKLQKTIAELSTELTNTNQEKSNLKAKLKKLEDINRELTILENKVRELISATTDNSEQGGGYQYKSKNKTRSKRIIKLNKFGLLKSRSKTNKKSKKIKKKPLKSKLKRRVKGKSVKKGGAKKKKSHKKTKKHLKSKRSRRHK